MFLFRAEAHPGNLPSEPPGTTLPAEASKGLGTEAGGGDGVIPSRGTGSVAPPNFLAGAPCLPTSLEPMKQFGICSAVQMISPRGLWHLSDWPTSQQDHKFSPALSNSVKNCIFVG